MVLTDPQGFILAGEGFGNPQNRPGPKIRTVQTWHFFDPARPRNFGTFIEFLASDPNLEIVDTDVEFTKGLVQVKGRCEAL